MDGVARTTTTTPPTIGQSAAVSRRPRSLAPPAVLLIGASTGGPQALTILMASLVPIVPHLPVCVTLHMPADLMPVIAAHITRTCGVETRVVQGPQDLLPGIAYFSPGDRHFDFRRRDAGSVDLSLRAGAPGDSCKPAVDVMMRSAAACFGPRALAVILSGMGEDGLAGAHAIVAAGGSVIVQDKGSSAVWGMPGAIAKADLAAAILTPTAIAEEVIRRTRPSGRRI